MSYPGPYVLFLYNTLHVTDINVLFLYNTLHVTDINVLFLYNTIVCLFNWGHNESALLYIHCNRINDLAISPTI
jgi:hypothetical protein